MPTMGKDPVPEWFGKGEAEPPRQRGSAEARSRVGCGLPVVLAIAIAGAGAGFFLFAKRAPSTKTAATVAARPTPEPVATPVPLPPPEEPVPVAPPAVEPEPAEPDEAVPAPSAPVTDGVERLSAAKIQVVMRAAGKRFRTCFENALSYAPDAQGSVRLSLTITPAGRVEKVSTTQAGNLPPQVAVCMSAITRTLKFPESPEPTTVTYPFVFSPG